MERVFSMLYQGQTYIVNEEELKSICPGLNLPGQYQIVNFDNSRAKQDCVQEIFLQPPQQ